MAYSGNNPKLTMIHDREGIHDLKEQLHRADQAYKSSPAHQTEEPSTPIYMTEDPQSYRSSLARHWQASNPMYDMPIMHDEAGRAGEGSPAMMHEGKTHAPETEGPPKGKLKNPLIDDTEGDNETPPRGQKKIEKIGPQDPPETDTKPIPDKK